MKQTKSLCFCIRKSQKSHGAKCGMGENCAYQGRIQWPRICEDWRFREQVGFLVWQLGDIHLLTPIFLGASKLCVAVSVDFSGRMSMVTAPLELGKKCGGKSPMRLWNPEGRPIGLWVIFGSPHLIGSLIMICGHCDCKRITIPLKTIFEKLQPNCHLKWYFPLHADFSVILVKLFLYLLSHLWYLLATWLMIVLFILLFCVLMALCLSLHMWR